MKVATQTSPVCACMYLATMTPQKNIKKRRVPLHTMTSLHFTLQKKTPAVFLFQTLQGKVYYCDALGSALGSSPLQRMSLGGSSYHIMVLQVVETFCCPFLSRLGHQSLSPVGFAAGINQYIFFAPPSSSSLWMSLMQVVATHPGSHNMATRTRSPKS